MKILAFTAGAARMFCGSCLRDNALAAELKRLGHDVILQPLYTPTRTDETNVSSPSVFLNGITVYLEQQSAFFRKPHALLDRLCDTPWMLKMAAQSSIQVDPHLLGGMTVSMLRGADGNQGKEVRKLGEWLRHEAAPDIAILPNSLLIGLARPVREALGRPVCCTLQGEELFLSQLQEPYRRQALELIRAKVGDVDGFVAVSEYSAAYWAGELGIAASRMHVVPLGINLAGFNAAEPVPHSPFRIGYLARIAPEKGLHVLADACLRLRRESALPIALEAAGYLAPEHRVYLEGIEHQVNQAGFGAVFHYRGELDRAAKVKFLRGLDLFSVPCTYPEPKGISVLEAMACGVPVVQPRHGAFPEILNRTGGGLLFDPEDPAALATAIRHLYDSPAERATLARRGVEAVRIHYTVTRMAERALNAYTQILEHSTQPESEARP